MKNILVPVDFSKQSKEAFKVALGIAEKSKCEVTLLHVLYLPLMYDSGPGGESLAYNPVYFELMEKDARKELEKIKNDSKANVKINIELEFGDVIACIKNSIEKYNSDMVILGSSGMSGIPYFVIGSTTEKVTRHSPVPVLAVRESFALNTVKNILLPSTLDLNQKDFIGEVKKLQDFFSATLHILTINTPGKFMPDTEANEAFAEFIKHYALTNCKTHFQNYKNEEEGILDFSARENIQLIAMGTHARKGLSHLFNGSITEDVLNKITVPIWTYCLKKSEPTLLENVLKDKIIFHL